MNEATRLTMDDIRAKQQREQDEQFEKIWLLMERFVDAKMAGDTEALMAIRIAFRQAVE
jgi:hypothetical protein